MVETDRWIKERSSTTLHPAQVETSLRQIAETWPATGQSLIGVLETFPLGEHALLHLLAVSTICGARLRRDPGILLWLSQPEICLARRGFAQMSNELWASAGDSIAADDFKLLRAWKGREMVRIA